MQITRQVRAVACLAEAATGLGLLTAPSLLAVLLFGAELDGVGPSGFRVAGIALIALAVACWPPGAPAGPRNAPYLGILLYNGMMTLFLASYGLVIDEVGMLFWPACVAHFVLTIVLVITIRPSTRNAT